MAPRLGSQSPRPGGKVRVKLGVMVSGLIQAGVITPPVEIERSYRDRRLTARIEVDGTVTCMGRNFGTLSSAAAFARTACGTSSAGTEKRRLSSNGWSFWQFRNSDGELETMRSLRRRFLKA